MHVDTVYPPQLLPKSTTYTGPSPPRNTEHLPTRTLLTCTQGSGTNYDLKGIVKGNQELLRASPLSHPSRFGSPLSKHHECGAYAL